MRRLQAKLLLSSLFSFMVMLQCSAVSFAETEPGQGLPESDFSPSGTLDSIQMIGKVIFFLILIIALFFVLIKFLAKKNKGIFGNSVRSLGGVPLGQNKSIQIIEIGHSLFIVGVGENIQLLDKISDADEVAYVSELMNSTQDEQPGLLSWSKWLTKLPTEKKVIEEDVEITSSFQQVFHDKLKHVTSRNKQVEEWLADRKQSDRKNDE